MVGLDLTRLPKAELHVHIEGTLEPEMAARMAARHGAALPWETPGEALKAFDFGSLQAFLDLYYSGMSALRAPADFLELALAYLRRAAAEGVVHAEIFFDPQAHRDKGLSVRDIADQLLLAAGIARAESGVTALFIPCVLRHLGEDAGLRMLDELMECRGLVAGIGLDSTELGYPPVMFSRLFRRARDAGLAVVAHAGEEGPADFIRQALDDLGAIRIDHGVRIMEDPGLVRRVARDRVPLTVCPVSNWKLGVCSSLASHPLPGMLDAGLNVTINSDDPAYLRGYIGSNFEAARDAMGIPDASLAEMARASLEASFAPAARKTEMVDRWRNFMAGH